MRDFATLYCHKHLEKVSSPAKIFLSMDFITDVTKLLRHYSPQTDGSFLPEGKLRKLFHLIVSEQATTDRQAVQLLYGPGARPEEKKNSKTGSLTNCCSKPMRRPPTRKPGIAFFTVNCGAEGK